jgi:hypothetical protein
VIGQGVGKDGDNIQWDLRASLYSRMGSHTPGAQLEFPSNNVANAGQAGQNHYGQPDQADQAANVENLIHCAKVSPSGCHSHPSFPKDLKFVSAIDAPFIEDFDCWECNQSAYPGQDGVGKPLRLYILAPTLRAFERYVDISHDHSQAPLC